MRIESIQVGKPKTLATDWTSAIYKTTVDGSIFLSKTNLEGDQQADLTVHGGPDKAVNVYPEEHYHYWNQRRRFLFKKRIELPPQTNGSFGENFTVSGLNESNVCIGDTFEIGSAIVQVSQPRQPCWKLGRKFNQSKLPIWVQKNGKTGWYFRVLQEGHVTSKESFTLTQRLHPCWTIERTNLLRYTPNKSKEDLRSILECDTLSVTWQKTFKEMFDAN